MTARSPSPEPTKIPRSVSHGSVPSRASAHEPSSRHPMMLTASSIPSALYLAMPVALRRANVGLPPGELKRSDGGRSRDLGAQGVRTQEQASPARRDKFANL